ncbi:MAG: 1-deoxy-D-xylulose-5-phosphate synthase [Actinomycetia bacterium]|nr:1-deoxy-D-xylulose-5-phosphate synthase [Actinomycetes bacterium]
MILESIQRPSDLRELDTKQLEQLCEEIREFIVETVNRTGGHLGSNLGIVELTIALHRVLSSPRDIILFDTGHQAYVHKLLTGRQDIFPSLKQGGGMSGYPNRAESDHDWIENSHASTVLSYAHGLATAIERGEPTEGGSSRRRRVVAVLGDGSMTGGMAFEGLNNLGHSGANVTVILNDNGRSYAPTVSQLSDSLVKIRSNPVYMRRQRRLESLTERIPLIGRLSLKGIRASKAAIREAFEPQAFFEPLGVRYMGPFDGHDIAEMETALVNAGKFDGPVVLHVKTQKGRGYAPAENDEIKKMHDASPRFLDGEVRLSPPPGKKPDSYTEAFTEGLVKLGEAHSDVVAITAAMPDATGLLPFCERFPDRFFDVGIAEQHAVTAAAGMAMGGLRPVIALYSTFLTRAFDQVNLDVGLHRLPVIFCLDRAGVTGSDGPSHHGILDMVLLSKVAGMTIFCPSSYQELLQMMEDAYELIDGPSCIRWPKTPAPSVTADQVGTGLRARLVTQGDGELCLIGAGKMLGAAQAAAEELAAEGISATVWDPRVIKPIDETLLGAAAEHRIVITVEDGLADGGFGSMVGQQLAGRGPTIHAMGVPTEYIPHDGADVILARLGLDGPGVAALARQALS